MIKMKKIFLLLFFCILLWGCGSTDTTKVNSITKEEVIEYMSDGALLIDVRTNVEYGDNHIDGAINIDVNMILEEDDVLIYNNSEIGKTTKIIVYCRSGSRSKNAANKLLELGYTNVYDFGSIDNWSE